MIPPPPGWRLSHHGDALRRRSGPAWLRLYRKRDRGGYFLSVELRLDCTDTHEAAALSEATVSAFMEAHQRTTGERRA